LIEWCLTPTSTVFQLYRGVNNIKKIISATTIILEIRHCQSRRSVTKYAIIMRYMHNKYRGEKNLIYKLRASSGN